MSDKGPGEIPTFTEEKVYNELVSKIDRAEPLTATEVGNKLNCTRRTALTKLNRLQENNKVKAKKVGGRAKVWWVPLIDPAETDMTAEEQKLLVAAVDNL